MELNFEQRGSTLIAAFKGRVDRLAVDQYKKQKGYTTSIWESHENISAIVIDLADVDFIDSMGLAMLVNAVQVMNRRSGKVVLISPGNPVQIILQYTRMDKAFNIQPTLELALKELSS